MAQRLKKLYSQAIIPKLAEQFNYKNARFKFRA